jgi:membrane-bound ClpP family serine protease
LEDQTWEETMIRLITVAFALVVSTSAQATPLAPLQQPDGMITQVREACGAGMHMVNGTCVRTAARRNAARCVVGMRTVGGRCVK